MPCAFSIGLQIVLVKRVRDAPNAQVGGRYREPRLASAATRACHVRVKRPGLVLHEVTAFSRRALVRKPG
jgi:hypothetical protein